MSTSTNYLRKLISSSFHEGSFSKVLRGKYLHGTHDLIKKIQPYGCVVSYCVNNFALLMFHKGSLQVPLYSRSRNTQTLGITNSLLEE